MFNNYLLRWFDHWLKDVDNGIMDEPPVMIHDSGSGETRYENELPPLKRTQWTKFYLRSNTTRPSSSPQGLVSLEAPVAQDEPDKYNAPRLGHASVDLSGGKPVLAYATPPLEKDVRVWGSLSATIYGSIETSNTSTWAWFVNLYDVATDGTIMSVSKGNLKACYRDVDESKSKPGHPWHPFDKVVNLKTNEIYDFLIELQPMFYTFKKGHKIQLEIMSDDPEFKIDNYGDLLPGLFPAEVSVYHDQLHPSHLLMPVVPDAPMIAPVKEPLF